MEARKEAQSLTMNTQLKLLQYKWLMRIYITPVVLHKYNENIPDTCLRCSNFKGTLYHCICECEEVRNFWKDVKGMIENILDVSIPLLPLIFLFHLYPKKINLKKTGVYIYKYMYYSSETAYFFKLEKYICTKYRMLAERNGNKYVNRKDNMY